MFPSVMTKVSDMQKAETSLQKLELLLSANCVGNNLVHFFFYKNMTWDGFKKRKKKLMEFSIKGPDPASQPLNGKKTNKKNMV